MPIDSPNTEDTDFFRKLADYSNDIISILSADGSIIYNNPSVEKAFGFPMEVYQNKNVADFAHPDDLTQIQQNIGALVSGVTDVAEVEFRFRHADGDYRQVHAVGLPNGRWQAGPGDDRQEGLVLDRHRM